MSGTRSDVGPFAIVPKWLILSGASANAIKCYAALGAIWADRNTDEAFPKRQTLARILGLSESTVDRTMKELEKLRAITIVPTFLPSGNQTSNTILIHTAMPMDITNEDPPSSPMTTPLVTHDEPLTRISEPESIDPLLGKPKPAALPRKKRGPGPCSKEQMDSLRTKFIKFIPDFDEIVAFARSHEAWKKCTDEYLYLNNWLKKDSRYLPSKPQTASRYPSAPNHNSQVPGAAPPGPKPRDDSDFEEQLRQAEKARRGREQ